MENKAREKLKILIAVASVALLTVLFTTRIRRRRKQKRRAVPCYLHADQKLKPQYSFKRLLAENSYSPFKHLKLGDSNDENYSTSHPYEVEVMALLEASRLDFEFFSDRRVMKRIDSFVWLETEQQLKELANLLSKEKVFAVDTEQHSFRSFLGFTALMQISTEKENYLIDTIKLHDLMEILRPVFSDPSICKVFHGADNDVLWLQRDFHIYVVNLFDTAKACDLLSKPQRSLAYLLESYCGIATNKMLQREDWRQRPLPEEMVQYARIDAQYLLYIANCLVAELRQKDQESSRDGGIHFVLEAYRRSNFICLQLYTKDGEASPGESAASSIVTRYLNGQGGESGACETQDIIRKLCAWRDLMARVHDESLRYVLADQAIVALADKNPVDSMDICDIIVQAEINADFSNSMPIPSPLVYSHMDDFRHLFSDKTGGVDEIFRVILQNCLGENGTCPLSSFNYGLFLNSTLKFNCKAVSKQNGISNSKQASRKASREMFVQKFSCKSPVYHNCRIFANDGRLLCYCDRRKLEWYLRRDLAKIVDEDPPAIMLLFEPKGHPEDEDNEFYIQSKKNICVGCGEGSHYLRYRIIPSCYRMHFPEHLKSHRSHDIVLLCVNCHEIAHAAAEKYKKKVAEEFGIPLFVRNIVDLMEAQVSSDSSQLCRNFEQAGVSPLELRTAAMALIRHGQRMPAKRREELTEVVRRFYGGRDISHDDLEKALLVGMSSHERRRFEKKNGISSKRSKGADNSDKEQKQGNKYTETSAPGNKIEADALDGLFTTMQKCGNYKDKNLNLGGVTEPTNTIQHMGSQNEGAATASDGSNQLSTAKDDCLSGTLPDEGINMSDTRRKFDSDQPKNSSKISLLGHGPHGKQVVEHILMQYGEEGISMFCQRWRQVFVEAVCPRFLPAGWDIKHSGRRDFGEYSVYNPSNKASAVAS